MNEFRNSVNVCIIGQGFVGLPLALSYCIKDCNVVGVDINRELVEELNNGITYHTEKYKNETIQNILRKQLYIKKYKANTSIAEGVKNSNNIIITVGIPIKDGISELKSLKKAIIGLAENLKKEDLVILRSTVIPGTTEEIVIPLIEKISGLKCGQDFYLAYASERIAEGKAFEEFENMPTIVAGVNDKSLERACELLKIICNADIIKVRNIKVVETSKVIENVQRDVNIAMVQEFARFTEKLGIDIFEVINVANTHKRVNLLTPGPGVGGYCIPNAYYYLKPKAEELDVDLELLKLSRNKNERVPDFIVSKVEELLNSIDKNIKNSSITVIGLSMKDYSNDFRLSPAEKIIDLLIEMGAEVKAFDPEIKVKKNYIVNSLRDALYDCDLILILAKQKNIDFEEIREFANSAEILIIDTKNVYYNLNNNELKRYWKI